MENAVVAIRKQLGLTQPQLAVALGVNLNTVWRWENGRTKPPMTALIALRAMAAAEKPDAAA